MNVHVKRKPVRFHVLRPTAAMAGDGAGRAGRRARTTRWAVLAAALAQAFAVPSASALEVVQFGEAGFLRIDYQLQARVGARDQGTDPARSETTYDFYTRRNRLSFIGALDERFGAVVQLELNGGQRLGDTAVASEERAYSLVLLDAFATADLADFFKVRAGKTKHVLTREVQEGCFDPLSIDRSPYITGPFGAGAPEKTTRDVGIVVWGNVLDRAVQYRLAVMQGNDDGSDAPDGIGFRYAGRVHVTLFDQESGIVYKGTYRGQKRVLTVGAGLELQRNAVHASGTTGSEDYRAYTYDLFYEHPTDLGTFTVSGAYLRSDFGEAGLRGVADAQGANGERSGWYWKAGYMLGPVQAFGRYERWSFASLNGVPGQRLGWVVAGVNWYLKDDHLRFTLEASQSAFEKAPANDFRTVLFQAQARF